MDAVEACLSRKYPDLLEKWLRSANVEKQLYAVYGLRILAQHGIPLTDENATLISYVTHKEGNVRSCSGCKYYDIRISEILR
jgi:hypothetical protein